MISGRPLPSRSAIGDPGPLVEPGKPIDFEPIAPAIHLSIASESTSHSIKTLVRALRIVGVKVVDMKYDQFRLTITVEIGHGNGRSSDRATKSIQGLAASRSIRR